MKGILELAITAMNDRDLVEYESVVDALLRAMCDCQMENIIQRSSQAFIFEDSNSAEKASGMNLCRSRMPLWTFSYNYIIPS